MLDLTDCALPPFRPERLRACLGRYASERAFLLYLLQLRPDGKYDKIPCDPKSLKPGGTPEERAELTFDEAAERAGGLQDLGYPVGVSLFPPKAPGLVVADIDGDALIGLVVPTGTYAETSPSGRGMHILFDGVRDQAGRVHALDRFRVRATGAEKAGRGLYGAETRKHITLTGWQVEGSAASIGAWDELEFRAFAEPLMTDRAQLRAAPANDLDADERWMGHWLQLLPLKDQEAAVTQMLQALVGTEDHDDREAWLRITFALADLDRRVSWDVKALWDSWSAWSPAFDRKGNEKAWCSEGQSGYSGPKVHWGTLIARARNAGFDIDPWQCRARIAQLQKRYCDASKTADGWGQLILPEITFAEPPTAPRMIVDRFLPAAAGVLQGADGIFKSTMALALTARVALGKPVGTREVREPGRVVLITKEDTLDIVRWRLHRHLEDMAYTAEERERVRANLAIVDLSGEAPGETRLIRYDREKGMQAAPFADLLIGQLKPVQPKLVILNPLVAFGHSEAMINDNESMLMFTANRIAADTRAAVLMIHHVGQAAARAGIDDQYAGRGGSALSGQSRVVHTMLRVRDATKARSKLGMPPSIPRSAVEAGLVSYINTAKLSWQAQPAPIFAVRGGPDAPFRINFVEAARAAIADATASHRESIAELHRAYAAVIEHLARQPATKRQMARSEMLRRRAGSARAGWRARLRIWCAAGTCASAAGSEAAGSS